MKRALHLAVLTVIVLSAMLAAIACGGEETPAPTPAPSPAPAPAPTPSPSPAPAPAPAAGTFEIQINAGKFVPAVATVPVGTRVIWYNQDSVRHWVTSDTGFPDTASIPVGARMSVTFKTAGTFEYYDLTYKDQKGTVIVTP